MAVGSDATVGSGSVSHVRCDLEFDVDDHVTLALQVAVADTAGTRLSEQLSISVDDVVVTDAIEHPTEHGGRIHVLRCGAGRLRIGYEASVRSSPPSDGAVDPVDAIVARRQSRYCPSDALEAFAAAELAHLPGGEARGRAIADWVHRRLSYTPGSSGPLDTAVDTLLTGQGVCRDFAHLTITLCRALGIPARLMSAYAPGLFPMDFHAVAEVVAGDRWEIVDATWLAPRRTLVRIGTGRDAADTAFATTLSGAATLVSSTVGAVVDGDLPLDEPYRPVRIP